MPDRIARVWTGSQWEVITSNSPSPNAVAVYQSASPSGPVTGQVWINSNTNVVNVWSGSAWVATNIDASNITSGTLAVARGGTGVTTSTGSGSTVLSASPALTGTPTAPTPSASVNTTQIATTAFVYNQGPLFTNRNLLYNGAMQVSQRGTSTTSITTSGYYTADRWSVVNLTQGTWTNDIQNDAPTGSGFRRSFRMLCTTADAAPAAGDAIAVDQILEGQDLQRIRKGTSSAQRLTLSFWVKTNVTGTYIAEMYDNDNARHVAASYNIAVGDSGNWVKRTITFPADTTGAFDNDNAASLYFRFYLGAGSNRTSGTLATSWASFVQANDAVGQTNVASAINNYWQVTGVQLETGDVATDFEFKSFGQDLRECQRYYYRVKATAASYPFGLAQCYGTTTFGTLIHFPTTMRTRPTALEQSGTASDYNIYSSAGSNIALTAVPTYAGILTTEYAAAVNGTVASGIVAGNVTQLVGMTSSAYLGWSAEL